MNTQYWKAVEYPLGKISSAKTISPALVITAMVTSTVRMPCLKKDEMEQLLHTTCVMRIASAHSPRSDVLRSLGKRSLMDIHHLPAVTSHLNVVANQCEEGSQRQGRGEQRFEAKAYHHFRVVLQTRVHQIVLSKNNLRIKGRGLHRTIKSLSPAPTRTPLPV